MVGDELMLREAMIIELHKLGTVHTAAVADALRAVRWHALRPKATPEWAYEAENAMVPKRDTNGTSLSSVSAAHMQAFMLGQHIDVISGDGADGVPNLGRAGAATYSLRLCEGDRHARPLRRNASCH